MHAATAGLCVAPDHAEYPGTSKFALALTWQVYITSSSGTARRAPATQPAAFPLRCSDVGNELQDALFTWD